MPITSARAVTGRRFFPLDQRLHLRADHWSEGAARVATRLGLQIPSFERGAEAYREAIGSSLSADSLRRITEGWGQQVKAYRTAEADRASGLGPVGESPRDRRVEAVEPIRGQANVSTDGAMVLIRAEGWKEVKVTTVSAVSVTAAAERPVRAEQPSRRDQDLLVRLEHHSYQAGLWDADQMARFQYAEGLRRTIDRCKRLSSVNDGAPWIERITGTNFPHALQIIDWTHAEQRLWKVATEVWGDQTSPGNRWVERQLNDLWASCTPEVIRALDDLALDQPGYSAEVQQAPDYFRSRQPKMQYEHFRAEGYPIGSGTVESAAKTVVQYRLKRPGRGWKRGNVQSMLAALSELHSGRFDHAWLTTRVAVA